MTEGTWLCPTDQDRARVTDNAGRVARARTVATIVMGATVGYAAPTLSWWLVPLYGTSFVVTQTLDARTRYSARPEYHAALTILWIQCVVGAAVALTGGPVSPMLALIAIPNMFAAARFRLQVATVATALAVVILLISTLVVDPAGTLAHPGYLIVALATAIGVSAAAHALTSAELQHRRAAVLDPLTGLLNRSGLENRFHELAEQARQTGEPISVLICDLDHFKAINDVHGHAVGDAVLRDVAYELRKELRSFELIYRIGGEEFLVVLPGATEQDALALGERLRRAVRRSPAQGISLTISVGVSASRGADVQFAPLFAAADRALYRAKAEGRDRVATSALQDPEARPPSAPLAAAR